MPGLPDSSRWALLPHDEIAERRLSRELGIPPLVARVLCSRGITDVESARSFLSPSLERDWEDPLIIPGMREAADRVERAIRADEHIAVFGDFDVDGMSSTCLLARGLSELGVTRVYPYIPHRFGEGYGLSREALARVMEDGKPDLVITVDNGIAAAAEVAWLTSQGIDVVVTDHHEPSDLVPQGVPVTDPKLDASCPSRELAGAGVALKLVQELGRRLGKPDLWRRHTDMATLGTISDMMLLTGENRALVADGISRLRQTDRPGVVALAAIANVNLAEVTSDSLPFSLIPRLNAAGRMGGVEVAFDLLYTDDPARATELAARLEAINRERREIESTMAEEALAKVDASYDGSRVIVVGGEGWHEGVKGIVASRIVSRYGVPAILFTISDGVARGSGRSVGSVDLFHAVEQCADLTLRFGGHAGAVGVTIDAENLDDFRERLGKVVSELPADQFVSHDEIAAVVGLDELTVPTIEALEMLQPFGQGNKKPLLAARGVCMRSRSCVGAGGEHLRFVATDGACGVPAIMFRTPRIDVAIDHDGPVDLVFDAVNETWQGRTKPKLMVRDILYRDAAPATNGSSQDAPSIADDLFARSHEILSRDEYAGIADATSFFTKAVGVTFGDRQQVMRSLHEGDELLLERQPDNPHDPCAIALVAESGDQVGFLRRQIASAIAPLMDEGTEYVAHVLQVTGGEEGRSLGVNVQVERVDDAGGYQASLELEGAAERARLMSLGPGALTDALRQSLIGDHALLPAQAAALANLEAGRSTLCVMATGRGKSLIFHIHAAREAILRGRASVFVYPLRALVADQSFHLEEAFSRMGMHVRVLTGETPLDERTATFGAVARGDVDVLLTTPEFLAIHVQRFAETGRVGFVVVDEAHHAGLSAGGNRSAYGSLPEVLDALGRPTALAVTATAATPVAEEICRLMGIDHADVVLDRSVRENLSVRDCRELRDRDAALMSIVASGDKCVVYVNSRDQSVSIARTLRKSIPDLGRRIAFYNAGLNRSERAAVEEAFRTGELTCIVSTSAFGEGVNLPDIRNVVLYHMPFGQVEFNQMSGRAGRDGANSVVHLLFGSRDARINERIISSSAPDRNALIALYRALRSLAQAAVEAGEQDFSCPNAEIAERALALAPHSGLDERSVSCGVSVFRELGFLTTTGYGTARRIHMVASPERMELERSIRYLEGLKSRDEFFEFREWALTATPDEMLARVNRPIMPTFGRVVGDEGVC